MQFGLPFVLAFILCGCAMRVGSKSEWSECARRTSSTGDVEERIFRRKDSVEKKYLISPEGPSRRFEVSKVQLYIQKGEGPKRPLRFLSEDEKWQHHHFIPLDDGLWFAMKVVDRREDGYVEYTRNLLARVFSSSGIVHEGVILGCYQKNPGSDPLTHERYILTPNWKPLRNDIDDYQCNFRIDDSEHRAVFRTYRGDYVFDMRSGQISTRKPNDIKGEPDGPASSNLSASRQAI